MHHWWGSKETSLRQASDRDTRAALRNRKSAQATLAKLTSATSDSEDDFRECDLSNSFLQVDGETSVGEVQVEPATMATKFEDEKGTDDDDYYKKLSSLSKRTFNAKEVEFWFTSFETSLKQSGRLGLRCPRLLMSLSEPALGASYAFGKEFWVLSS